jgi:integrase
MTDNPAHHSRIDDENKVLVEMTREQADVLAAHPGVDIDIEEKNAKGSDSDQPRATTIPLPELLDMIASEEKQKAIGRGENHYVKHFIGTKCSLNLSPNSAQRYVGMLNEYVELVPFDGDGSFLNVDWGDITRYIKYLISGGNRWKTFSGKINLLKRFYRHITTEFSTRFALDMARIKRLDPKNYDVEVEEIEREPLSPQEIRKLVDALDSLRNRLIVRLAYQAALRNSEVRNLKLQHFDPNLDAPKIHISDSKYGKSRDVPLTQEMALDLEHWIDVVRGPFSPFAPESEYLFPSKDGVKLETNRSVWKIVRDAVEESEIESQKLAERADGATKYRIDVHTLRHTGNTHWKDCGIGIRHRMEALGHENEKTTKGYSPDSNEDSFSLFRSQFDPAV